MSILSCDRLSPGKDLAIALSVNFDRGGRLPAHAPDFLLQDGSQKMKFSDAVAEFLQFCAVERQLSQHTIHAYACDLRDFANWLPANAETQQILPATLTEYLTEILSVRKLTAATTRRRFACLRSLFRRLVLVKQAADPFVGWQLHLPRRKRLPRALSRPEISSLILSLHATPAPSFAERDQTLGLAVRLMVSTGIRVGELCKLKLDDIAPDGSSCRIHGTLATG
jgi:site-specific recombinase XerD